MNESSREIGLIGGPEHRPIEIADYDLNWPLIFQKHARTITEHLGATALRIEHIGSTSVPGLAAKPIVDILVVVPNSANEHQYLAPLIAAGYELRVREPDFFEHRMFRTPARDVHIHVYSPDSPEIDRYLVFRDRLRTNSEFRQRYEQTKRNLATQAWNDMNDYANAKTEIIERIIADRQRS